MGYIEFDKLQLINLNYSLDKELIRSNRSGSFACTTIIGCNTRKYHGLFITRQPAIDDDYHVLLSCVDETIIERESEFNLGIHKYPGTYHPKGHKYIRDFITEPVPVLTYRVGGIVLTKETLLSQNDERILIRYTLKESHSPIIIRLRPFLAFRNRHQLSKANVWADKKYEKINHGIKCRMYSEYSDLFMQISKDNEYVHAPDWYKDIEYSRELERGYEAHEDLYVPGFFEIELKKGETIIFSAGLTEKNHEVLKGLFTSEVKRRIPRNSFENCLINAAQQFIVKHEHKTEVIAGFPWFGRWGRDTFISLPGLTLTNGDFESCKAVIDTMVSELKGPLFPNIGSGENTALNSVDAPLWFFWALQQYATFTGSEKNIWQEYSEKMKLILEGYRKGTSYNIHMLDNGLIYAGEQGKALTWMDAVIDGNPVTPRTGLCVEINALWYNAIMFSIEVALLANDKAFVEQWLPIAEQLPASFKNTFWSKEKGYLADYVCNDYIDWTIRPNQVIATSLPYKVVSEPIRKLILDTCTAELLTPRGLRTLTPKHPDYIGKYFGNQTTRDAAYHQGTVWPWLLGHFAEGYLTIFGKQGVSFIKNIYKGFEETIREEGIGTISEVYDGDPPHKPGGCISQAWSVSELLRMNELIKKYDVEE